MEVRAERRGDGIEFMVSDTGRGIAPEEQALVFEEFYQSTPPEGGKSAGTGLGLTVSLRLAEMLGGSIELASALGAGTTFTVHLPTESPSGSEPALPG